jgi:hypothetical protein
MAAIEAGKHVYCEWPLGRNTDEAIRMRDAADRNGIRHAVGLQGQVSPAINYTKDLIVDGYVGRVLSATMIGCAANWGPTIDRAYQADFANGANLLTITGGHTIPARQDRLPPQAPGRANRRRRCAATMPAFATKPAHGQSPDEWWPRSSGIRVSFIRASALSSPTCRGRWSVSPTGRGG